MKNITTIITILMIYILSSSGVPSKIRDNFQLCYDPNTNYENSIIKFNGYYTFVHLPYKSSKIINGKIVEKHYDSSFSGVISFKDGIIKDDGNHTFRKNYNDSSYLYDKHMSGLYKIEGDTLKIITANYPYSTTYKYCYEEWYKIINDSTLIKIYYKDQVHEQALIFKRDSSELDDIIVRLEFVKTDIIIPSKTWLKDEDWFWCKNRDK